MVIILHVTDEERLRLRGEEFPKTSQLVGSKAEA